MAWNDREMSMRKWSIDADFVLPNETTHRREWRVAGSNVSSGSLSKSTHSEPTNNIEANCWDILPRGHKVLLWQLFKTIQGRIFVRSPNAARWRHQLNSGVDLQFCPPNTCLIRYLFDTLQLTPWWPISTHTTYLLEPPQRLWLKDCLIPYYDLGSPNLDLGTFLKALGPFKHF